MSDTSRQPASGTTEQDELVEAGLLPGKLVNWHVKDSNDSIPLKIKAPLDLGFRVWELLAKIRHVVMVHTWIDIEDWSDDGNVTEVTIIGQACWLCPARR